MVSKGPYRTNCAPVELHRRTDAIDSGSEDDYSTILELDVMFDGIVGGVEVVGKRWKFSGDGIDLLNKGRYTSFLTKPANGEFGGSNAAS